MVVDEIIASGGFAILVQADVSKKAGTEVLVEETLNAFDKKIHILVNNAGITKDNFLMRMDEECWDEVIATDLKGPFLMTQAVIRHMMRQRYGRIINMSSVSGQVGNLGQPNYAAAKGGLISLTMSTAREVASRRITVNAVAPGFINTEMTEKLDDKMKQAILSLIPFARFGEPEDVAPVVAFLASDEAEYITGQVISVNGGMLMG